MLLAGLLDEISTIVQELERSSFSMGDTHCSVVLQYACLAGTSPFSQHCRLHCTSRHPHQEFSPASTAARLQLRRSRGTTLIHSGYTKTFVSPQTDKPTLGAELQRFSSRK